jgi:CubicO group peptidase (beta-lactamase class C family)
MLESEFAGIFPQTHAVITQGIERGLHTGCQIYVSRHGNVLADVGIGETLPGVPMTPETINLWLSSGKPLTAVAILQAWERTELRLDDRVARFLPEFSRNGKGNVTIRHLLTHTGGFRNVETGWPDVTWDESIRRICDAPLEDDWIVGRTAGYHTASSWFILGEVLHRIEGRPYAEILRDRLLQPLHMDDTWTAMSPEQHAAYGGRIGGMFAREHTALQLLDWNSASRAATPSPGSNTRGPIRELGRFYEMLLNEGAGPVGTVLLPQTVAAMTARHRVGELDRTFGHIIDFGLGVIIDSNRYGVETVPYGYGRNCSPRAFGHGGAQSSQGWCDPETGLVVAYFFNTRAGEGQHNRRTRQLNEAIARDAGVAGQDRS